MAKRIEKFLTDSAQPIADKLAARYGGTKNVLSAGVVALEMLQPADRDRAFAIANGQEKIPESHEAVDIKSFRTEVQNKIDEILKELEAVRQGKKHRKKANPLRSA